MLKAKAAERPKKTSSFSGIVHKIKRKRQGAAKNKSERKNMLQQIFHPEYILFDWEFFSRELEFELMNVKTE